MPDLSQTPSGPSHPGASRSSAARHLTSSRRMAPRIIRTFEEISVTKEEWYEELECGVCSHILGATQSLVPCGHSLCGPCTWTWIRKNKSFTCPHCRVELDAATPHIPNIVVDQIIERKLSGLPESADKAEMSVERQSKFETWKMLQAAVDPPKPRRNRGIDDVVLGLFSDAGVSRRASHHIALGEPLPRRQLRHDGPNLSELRRQGAEEDAVFARAEIRRLREQMLREVHLPAVEEMPPPNPRAYTSPTLHRPHLPRQASGSQSQVLAARQARGRVPGTRDQPMVLSDDD